MARQIERQILKRTWGRVHRINVELGEDQVTVSGHSDSYYGKQLALQAILDVLGRSQRIELNVEVEEPVPSDARGGASPVAAALVSASPVAARPVTASTARHVRAAS